MGGCGGVGVRGSVGGGQGQRGGKSWERSRATGRSLRQKRRARQPGCLTSGWAAGPESEQRGGGTGWQSAGG